MELLSDEARWVLASAAGIAARQELSEVDAPHLLAALVVERGSVQSVLARRGLTRVALVGALRWDPAVLDTWTEERAAADPPPEDRERPTFGAAVKGAMSTAVREALGCGAPDVGASHLAAGLLLREDPAVRAVLARLEVPEAELLAELRALGAAAAGQAREEAREARAGRPRRRWFGRRPGP